MKINHTMSDKNMEEYFKHIAVDANKIMDFNSPNEEFATFSFPVPQMNNVLVKDDFIVWRKESRILYASRSVNNIVLRMWTYGDGRIEVCSGQDVIYNGNDVDDAIEIYNTQLL